AERIPELAEPGRHLRQVAGQLEQMQRLDTPVESYEGLVAQLGAGPLGVKASTPLGADLWRPLSQGTLGPVAVREMLAVATLLAGLPRPPSVLQEFAARFVNRYDTRFVPLLSALDEEHGPGFGQSAFREEIPLLDGLPTAPPPGAPPGLDAVEQRLLWRLLEATGRGDREIVLEDGEFGEPRGPLPSSFAVLTTLAAASGHEVDRGHFQLLAPALITPSGASFLGRFGALDGRVEAMLRAHVAAEEERSGELLVDVVELPSGRGANLVFRPPTGAYELVLQGRSGAPSERQIWADELLVGVRDDRFALFCPRLDRWVRPRATNSLNPFSSDAPPLRRFIGHVEQQWRVGRTRLRWGLLSESAPFLPRLTYRRSILQPARWNLRASDLAPLGRLTGAALVEAVGELCAQRQMPRWVSVSENDNTLPIDLQNPLSVEVLAHLLRSGKPAFLEEFLPALLPRPMRGDEGTFVHELLVPFAGPAAAQPGPSTMRPVPSPAATGTVVPGGAPLYAKIHGGTTALEAFLLDELPEVLEAAGVTSWFFVRYEDAQGGHLRLR
ncbi:MAG: hypothetical protein EOO75_12855, partial [Myxococcales bacterium]